MSASVFVVALLLVAGVHSTGIVTKENWDRVKGHVEAEGEDFAKNHEELKNAIKLLMDVWAAVGKYDKAIGDLASAKAIEDAEKMYAEEQAGGKPSADEVAAELADSDATLADAAEGIALETAVVNYIVKKEPDTAGPLKALYDTEVAEITGRE